MSKELEKYIKAVKRRLELPGDVKQRVISDFASSLQARLEQGMTFEEIRAELGNPKEAAAELNGQMKEYAYRKSPWRFLFAAGAAYGLAELISAVAALLVWLSMGDPVLDMNAASIGIIGGADGPTAIFVTAAMPNWWDFLLPVLLIGGCVWCYFRLKRCKGK